MATRCASGFPNPPHLRRGKRQPDQTALAQPGAGFTPGLYRRPPRGDGMLSSFNFRAIAATLTPLVEVWIFSTVSSLTSPASRA